MGPRHALALIALLAAAPAASQPAATEDIVVTAQRIGVPYWTVRGPTGTVLLLAGDGGIPENAAGNVAALTATMRQADQILYPGRTSISLSPLKMAGYYFRWRRMSSLPKGTTLQSLLSPQDYRRLYALHQRGLIKSDFQKTHPFPLSVQLKRAAFGEPRGGKTVLSFVEQISKQYGIRRVPPPTIKAKPVADAFFGSDPRESVPCLLATIDLVEAGRGAGRPYADAWRTRRVPQILNSPIHRAFELCIPPAVRDIDRPDVRPQVRSLMRSGKLTVAVVPITSLAKPGGVLDDLKSANYAIEGPAWR